MIPRTQKRVPGGFLINVEVPGAYVDVNGNLLPRFDDVFIATEDWRGKTLEEKQDALNAAVADEGEIQGVVGATIPIAPTQTKAVLEGRAVARYEVWQRWKATRIESQSRALSAALITALTTREDAAWAAYLTVLQQWRTAP